MVKLPRLEVKRAVRAAGHRGVAGRAAARPGAWAPACEASNLGIPAGRGAILNQEGGSCADDSSVDGADLPVVNIDALKAYEVAKYASMTYDNYGPTVLVMNLDLFKSLTPEQQKLVLDVGREAQTKVRQLTESVDNFRKAKEILEPKGMKVNQADVASFRKVAEEKIWPQ